MRPNISKIGNVMLFGAFSLIFFFCLISPSKETIKDPEIPLIYAFSACYSPRHISLQNFKPIRDT